MPLLPGLLKPLRSWQIRSRQAPFLEGVTFAHVIRNSPAWPLHGNRASLSHLITHQKKTFIPEMFYLFLRYFTFVRVIRIWRRQGEVFEHWDRRKWWSEWTAHRWEISWVLSLCRTGSRLVMHQSDKKADYILFLKRLNLGKPKIYKGTLY